MMTNSEVSQAADIIEETLEYMLDLDALVGNNKKLYVSSTELCVNINEDTSRFSTLRNNYNSNYTLCDRTESGIYYGLSTWLQYYSDYTPRYHTNVLLKTRNNNNNILLSTNASNCISTFGVSMVSNMCEFELQQLGTHEADEYFFLKSLEYDDLIMNALLFQSEWKMRSGANIVLRIGTDPLKTCSELKRIARKAYDRYTNPE